MRAGRRHVTTLLLLILLHYLRTKRILQKKLHQRARRSLSCNAGGASSSSTVHPGRSRINFSPYVESLCMPFSSRLCAEHCVRLCARYMMTCRSRLCVGHCVTVRLCVKHTTICRSSAHTVLLREYDTAESKYVHTHDQTNANTQHMHHVPDDL
jgi:hypothetical protein